MKGAGSGSALVVSALRFLAKIRRLTPDSESAQERNVSLKVVVNRSTESRSY